MSNPSTPKDTRQVTVPAILPAIGQRQGDTPTHATLPLQARPEDCAFVNPFLAILQAANADANTDGIAHRATLTHPMPLEVPQDYPRTHRQYYNEATFVEVNQHLSMLLPQILAIKGPTPMTNYNAIISATYELWKDRVRLWLIQNAANPTHFRNGKYDMGPVPQGMPPINHYAVSFVGYMENKLRATKDPGLLNTADEDAERVCIGRQVLAEFKRWSKEWSRELEDMEARYKLYGGQPPAPGEGVVPGSIAGRTPLRHLQSLTLKAGESAQVQSINRSKIDNQTDKITP